MLYMSTVGASGKPDYQCVRCGYATRLKNRMVQHFSGVKPCPAAFNKIDLIDKIKQDILLNRVHIIEFDNSPERKRKIRKINIASRTIPKRIKDMVWDEYVGPYIAQTYCFVCESTIIKMSQFDCGHVIAVAKGGKTVVSNLRPICHACNLSMGTRSMTEFKETHRLGSSNNLTRSYDIPHISPVSQTLHSQSSQSLQSQVSQISQVLQVPQIPQVPQISQVSQISQISQLPQLRCQHGTIVDWIQNMAGNDLMYTNKGFYYRDKASGRWIADFKKIRPHQLIKEVISELEKQQTVKVTKWIARLLDNNFIKNVIQLMEVRFAAPNVKFDENVMLLGFEDGVLDLKENQFRSARHDEYVSKSVGYSFPTQSQKTVRDELLKMLLDILGTEEDRDYLLKILASCLIGDRRFEQFYILSGIHGRNGKGSLTKLLERVFGDYFKTIDITTLTKTKKNANDSTPGLANKMGARILMTSEPEGNDSLMVSTLKLLTGRDTIEVRPLYQNPIEYTPQFTLFIQANEIPQLSRYDNAIRERVRIVNFPFRFIGDPKGPNDKLADSSLKERIINSCDWREEMMLLLLETYQKYVKDNFTSEVPKTAKVIEACQNYLSENNPIGEWLSMRFDVDEADPCNDSHWLKSSDLFTKFKEENPDKPMNMIHFGKLLRINKIQFKKTKIGNFYCIGNTIPI